MNDSINFFSQLFGITMWPLWLCSIVLLALFNERRRSLRSERILDSTMVGAVCDLLSNGQLSEAGKRAGESTTLQGQAWAQGLHEHGLGGVSMNEALTTASLLAMKPLRRTDGAITTIATIAPLLGLFGTIIGMIITFEHIHATGGADKAELAGGISTALFTTAAGLIIAIPAIIGGRHFRARLHGYAETIEADINRAHYCLAHHRAHQQTDAQPPEETSA